MRLGTSALAAFVTGLSAGAARADVTVLTPDRDTSMCEWNGSCATGNEAAIAFGIEVNIVSSDLPATAVLHFDVAAALPAGATINAVELQLRWIASDSAAYGFACSLSKVSETWAEDATWSCRAPPTLSWAVPGGTTSALLAQIPLPPSGSPSVWTSTPTMVADVQAALDQPAQNLGWKPTTSDALTFVGSRESPGTAFRPTLTIDWTPPPPPCSSTSYCIGAVNSRGTSAQIGATGSLSVSQNRFALTLTGAVPHSTAFFLFGDAQQLSPWGNGFLCVGGQLYRVLPAQQLSSTGSGIRPIDMTTNPGFRLTPGSTWNFQCKYRDVAGGGALFNASDGVSVTFCP